MTTLPTRALAMFGLIFAIAFTCAFDGCTNNNGTVIITYHQVGSCNGWDAGAEGEFNAGPNAAYVVFRVDTINNTQGNVNFNLDPSKLYVNGGGLRDYMNPGLSLANYIGVFSLVPTTINKGTQVGLDGFTVTIVQTANPNGAVEANQTTYYLLYNTGPSDPGVLLETDRTWQPLQNPTLDCTLIKYD
jgi:hypothetical protein